MLASTFVELGAKTLPSSTQTFCFAVCLQSVVMQMAHWQMEKIKNSRDESPLGVRLADPRTDLIASACIGTELGSVLLLAD